MPISHTFLYLSVADPDLQIRGRPGHPDPEIRRGGGGGAVSKNIFFGSSGLPWVPEVFLACSGNFRCWLKADTSSVVGRKKSLAPRVLRASFWWKNKGGARAPTGPSPGSATAYKKIKSIFLKFATILY